MENVFCVEKGAPYTVADLTALAAIFDTWDNSAATSGKSLRTASCVLLQIKCRALDAPTAATYTYTIPAGGRAGALAGTNIPPNVTFCLRLQTGLSGRSYRGRLYLVPFTTNVIGVGTSANLVTAAFAGNAVTSYGLLKTALATGGSTWVVRSQYNAGAWRVTSVLTPITTIGYYDLTIDTQRRRLH